MKKSLFILIVLLCTSCGCMLSQIPPQKIYATASCNAALPDYRLKITASDNCEIATFTQTPAPGYLLTSANKVATVVVKATDASGNFKQVSFTVTLLDTIKPVFTIAPELLAYSLEQIGTIYDYADKLIFNQERLLYSQTWIDSIPGLRDKLAKDEYLNKAMLTWTGKGHALTGFGHRYFTFYNAEEGDTIILPKFNY